jgi:hypothetical protein
VLIVIRKSETVIRHNRIEGVPDLATPFPSRPVRVTLDALIARPQ